MTMDQPARAMTAAVLVLLVVALAPLWFFFFAFPQAERLHVAVTASTVVVVAALVLSWAMAPVAAVLSPTDLLIRRRAMRPKRFPRASFTSASEAPRRLGLRVAGVGGFFGSFGLFWASGGTGFYWLYTARVKAAPGAQLARRRGKPLVVVPDEGAAFLAAVRDWLARP